MKTWLTPLLCFGAALASPPPSLASGGAPQAHGGLRGALTGLPALRAADFPMMASRYRETTCVSLSRPAVAEKLGFVCRTRDPLFVEDMGITQFNALPASARPTEAPASGLLVLTPMAAYPLAPMEGVDGRLLAATVDCDLENAAIYRASASCHVGVLSNSDGTTVYGSLLVQAHTGASGGSQNGPAARAQTGARTGLQPAEVRSVWQRLLRP